MESSNPNSDEIQHDAATIQLIDPDIILFNAVYYDATLQTYENLPNLYFSAHRRSSIIITENDRCSTRFRDFFQL